MPIEVRPGRSDEVAAFAKAVGDAFGGEDETPEEIASWQARLGDRFFVAAEGASIVGGAADFPFRLSVPGGEVAAAGVTGVGVLPTHRRQGILTRLMRLELDAIAARGEPVAILWASEGGIYQRFGYGLAVLNGSFELPRARSAFRLPLEPRGRVRLIERAEAERRLPPLFERWRRTIPGAWARSAAWWKAILDDPEHRRRGDGPKFFALHEDVRGRPDAYAIYRIHPDWGASGPKNTLRVLEPIALGAAATRELWRYLCDVDLVGTIAGRFGPVDHPLLHLLAEPAALGLTISDGLWLRLVDVVTALEARGYGSAERNVLEVADAFRPGQAGRYAIDATGDRPAVTRTRGRADLALEAADLAAIYLGGIGPVQLAAVGRVTERTPGAIGRAGRMFRSQIPLWSP